MESRPQNPEFRNNPENFHPCTVPPASLTMRPILFTNYSYMGRTKTSLFLGQIKKK